MAEHEDEVEADAEELEKLMEQKFDETLERRDDADEGDRAEEATKVQEESKDEVGAKDVEKKVDEGSDDVQTK